MSDSTPEHAPDTAPQDDDREPDTEELEEPSTAKDPGEEPKASDGGEDPSDDGKSHHAVGIGVVESEVPDEDARGA
ncbi:hypothetical protein [Microbacterium dauci]|uniref:Uncharacterized protein n=1 Tax=Microbacterium dauci TaxID=3048008 RepID=A0ABT6ZCW4_9MICO|nr:hypothetical protein [Microbacterium sp. LX3-4]MDJ1113996.1 hypothetical protein [Microbacterium sp. LX3-4]